MHGGTGLQRIDLITQKMLQNSGNTCFADSPLTIMLHSKPFMVVFPFLAPYQQGIVSAALPLVRELGFQMHAPEDTIDFVQRLCEKVGWSVPMVNIKIGITVTGESSVYQRTQDTMTPILTMFMYNVHLMPNVQAFLTAGITSEVDNVFVDEKYVRMLTADHFTAPQSCFMVAVRRDHPLTANAVFLLSQTVEYQGVTFSLRGVVYHVGGHYSAELRSDHTNSWYLYDDCHPHMRPLPHGPSNLSQTASRLLFFDR